MAQRLSAAGHRVIAIARAPGDALTQAASEAASAGTGCIEFRPFDLSDLDGLPELVRSLRAEFGILHGLVNNAGIGTPGVLGMMPDRDIEALFRLNCLSPVVLTKYVVRAMMAVRAGRIVNVSSIVAATGYPGLSVYSATKAALIGFTQSLAREVGELGITVNAVAPGFIDTQLTQELDPKQRAAIARRSALKRMAEPDDVARAVEYLLGAGGRNITGTVLTVDAGATA